MSTRINTKEILYFKVPLMLLDIAAMFGVFYLITNFTNILKEEELEIFRRLGSYILLAVSYLINIQIVKITLTERIISRWKVLAKALGHALFSSVIFMLLEYLLYQVFPVKFYLWYIPAVIVAFIIVHISIRLIISYFRRRGNNQLKILYVGGDANIVHIYHVMMKGFGLHGYEVLGFFSDKYNELAEEGCKHLGKMDKVIDFIKNNEIDEVFCSVNPAANEAFVNAIIHECDEKFIQFWYVPNMNGYPHHRMKYTEFDRVNIISLRPEPLTKLSNQILKRAFDIFVSGLFLITIYPFVWVFAAIGIKLSSPGPILFRQKRTGYSGEEFDCLKFRSMKVNADSDRVQATADDPRKTKFGDFMRRTSIDELPQVINVFKGDMSIVGPRPHMDFHTELYSKLISTYMVRHLVKPGITGWAQVNGCRGETKTVDQMKERVEHDIWYIEHWSFWLDIRIMFMTVAQIVKGDEQAY